MQKKAFIPTPLLDSASKRPVEIVAARRERFHFLRILHFILRASLLWWKASFQLLFTGRSDIRAGARQLRLFLEERGGLWIKAGQIVSLRRDIFRPETCDELSRLQDSARGFPWEAVKKVVEEDLGKPIEDVFSEFSTTPLAAASIGQVHEARLRENGVRVVIKVQRPYVAESFRRDLRFLRFTARWLERLGVARQGRWNEMVWELEKAMGEELDYRMEASSIRRMRKTLRPQKVYAPKVFLRYCSRRMLVMEFVEGVFMSDYIRVSNQDPARLRKWLDENQIRPAKVGERLYMMHQRQLMEHNLMHCDLHPGNIVLLRKNRVALIDFGSVASVEKTRLQRYRMLFGALGKGDFEKMIELFLIQSPPLPNGKDLNAIKGQMLRAIRSWEARTAIKNLPYHEKSLSKLYADWSLVARQNGLSMAWDFLGMSRAELTLDSSLEYLCPKADFIKLARKYTRGAQRRLVQRASKPVSLRETLATFAGVVDLPNTIAENVFHESQWLRNRAISFEGKVNKLAILARTGLNILSLGALGTLVFAVTAYVRQRNGHSDALEPRWLRETLDTLPAFGQTAWILIGIGAVYLLGMAARIRSYVQEKDYERPGGASR